MYIYYNENKQNCMILILKIWFKNKEIKNDFKKEFTVEINNKENVEIINMIQNNLNINKDFILNKINIDKKYISNINFINGYYKNKSSISLMIEIYVKKTYVRILKVENLLK